MPTIEGLIRRRLMCFSAADATIASAAFVITAMVSKKLDEANWYPSACKVLAAAWANMLVLVAMFLRPWAP